MYWINLGLMISTDDLRFFVTLARSTSLAAAARTLNVTPPAVTQRLRLMEERLGLRLVDRSGRRMVLTDEGDHLANGGRRILEEIGELADTLSARRAVVSGHLRVVAPLGFGRNYVAPAVARFRTMYPEVTLSLRLSDRPGRLADDACDVILYVGQLRNSSLVTRYLAPNERFICATPEYLAQAGTPSQPRDLLKHKCIALRENDEDMTMWRFTPAQRGKPVGIRIEPTLSCNDGEVIRAWALGGAGIIMRSEWHVAEDLRAGRLVRVLSNWRLPPANIVALLGARHGRSARTARFLELLHSMLTPAPWRQDGLAPADLGQASKYKKRRESLHRLERTTAKAG
jgi:DNA-binding transcriptional LysR family regulator